MLDAQQTLKKLAPIFWIQGVHMKKFSFLLLVLLLALCFIEPVRARLQEQTNQTAQSSSNQIMPRRHRRHRRERRRRGIKHSYGQAGQSMGRGSKRFGKNIAKRKPIKAGQEMGQGAGEFGQNVAEGSKGVGQKSKNVGRKIVHKTKKVVKPSE